MQSISILLAVSTPVVILVSFLCLIAGAVLCWLAQHMMGNSRLQIAEGKVKNILDDARQQAENVVKTAELESKAEAIQRREEFEREAAKMRDELRDLERHLTKREDTVDRKWETVTNKEKNLDERDQKLSQREREISNKDKQLSTTLQEQRSQLLAY